MYIYEIEEFNNGIQYTHKDVLIICGLAPREVVYMTERGTVTPVKDANGHNTKRLYSYYNLIEFMIAFAMRRLEISHAKIQSVLNLLKKYELPYWHDGKKAGKMLVFLEGKIMYVTLIGNGKKRKLIKYIHLDVDTPEYVECKSITNAHCAMLTISLSSIVRYLNRAIDRDGEVYQVLEMLNVSEKIVSKKCRASGG